MNELYNDPEYGVSYVICPICNLKARRIGQHLTLKHGIDVEEFSKLYPEYLVKCKKRVNTRIDVSTIEYKFSIPDDNEYGKTYVICPYCGRRCSNLFYNHLQTHGIYSVEELYKDFDGVKYNTETEYLRKQKWSNNLWKDENFKSRRSKCQSELMKSKYKDPQYMENFRRRRSESTKLQWRYNTKYVSLMREVSRKTCANSTRTFSSKTCYYTNRQGKQLFLKSRYELLVAFSLDYLDIPYEYESKYLVWYEENSENPHYYKPDFLVYNKYIEVKGYSTCRFLHKMNRLQDEVYIWYYEDIIKISPLPYSVYKSCCDDLGYIDYNSLIIQYNDDLKPIELLETPESLLATTKFERVIVNAKE